MYTAVTTESLYGQIPVHSAKIRVAEAETRVDYMSSCILLGRITQLVAAGSDHWEGLHLAGEESKFEEVNIQVSYIPPLQHSCVLLALYVQVGVELSWEQVQLAIHRTTTKSLLNIVQKIQDFILQQKRRSERTISVMLPADTRVSKALAAYWEKEKQAEQKRNVDDGELE